MFILAQILLVVNCPRYVSSLAQTIRQWVAGRRFLMTPMAIFLVLILLAANCPKLSVQTLEVKALVVLYAISTASFRPVGHQAY